MFLMKNLSVILINSEIKYFILWEWFYNKYLVSLSSVNCDKTFSKRFGRPLYVSDNFTWTVRCIFPKWRREQRLVSSSIIIFAYIWRVPLMLLFKIQKYSWCLFKFGKYPTHILGQFLEWHCSTIWNLYQPKVKKTLFSQNTRISTMLVLELRNSGITDFNNTLLMSNVLSICHVFEFLSVV